MGHANRDYDGYRGRRTVTDALRFIAIALAVIVVLVLVGVFYFQRYIVYTDEGPKLELPPFLEMFRREKGEPNDLPSLPDPSDVSIVINPDGSQSGLEPGAHREAGYILELPVSEVIGGTAAAKLEEAGAEALVLQVKASSGQLAWHSDLFAADWAEVNAPRSNNDALKQWNDGEVYTIARVCCFRDDSVPYSMNNLALRRGEFNWRDDLGLRWLSPAQEDAQAYIAGLCGELAALGFEEILLEQFHFPTQGNVGNIKQGDRYDPARFTNELEDLLDQVRQAVEPYGAKLSLRVERDTLAGEESISGVTAALLEQYAHRIWVEEDGSLPTSLELLRQAGITGGTERLVSITAARGEGGTVTQAALAES